MRRLFFIASFFLTLLTGCNAPVASAIAPGSASYLVTADPNATATPTPFQPLLPTNTPVPPTETFTPTPLPDTPTPEPTATQPTPTPFSNNLAAVERPQYSFYVQWDYAGHVLNVDQQVVYTNHTGDTLSDLVMAVEPNFWQGGFWLKSLSVNGTVLSNYDITSHRFTIYLPQPLAPGETVSLSMSYDLSVPLKKSGLVYGFTDFQTNLVDWYPFIVPYQPVNGWVLHDVYPWGENLVYEAADFDVFVRFTDPANTPILAASAPADPAGDWTHYRLSTARTFSFSASPYFQVASSVSGEGIPVTCYYFSGHGYSGQDLANYGAQALSVYSQKFGAYQYQTLSIIETYLPDGMEYDGMVFISSRLFDSYTGYASSDLTSITVHEIAHQWWFGKVGNDQTLEPWLDEAIAIYSERIFYETTNPSLVNWWWGYRVNNYQPTGWVDTTVFNGGSFRTYTNAVYLVGGYFLENLRGQIGDEAFFAFIQDYATQMSGKISTANDFFRILREHTNVDISDLIARYFQYPH